MIARSSMVDQIFGRYGRDPDRPVTRDDEVPLRLIHALGDAQLVDDPKDWVSTREPSARELEVLAWYSRGLDGCMVADVLHLSRFTVEDHAKHVRLKLGAKTTLQACCEAIRRGLIQ